MEINDGIILIEKSFFQSLNPIEAKNLNDRYNTFICSVLYGEILGDLKKENKIDKDGNLRDTFLEQAKKIPRNARFTYHSFELAAFNILGYSISMLGEVPELCLNDKLPYEPKNILAYLQSSWPEKNMQKFDEEYSEKRRALIDHYDSNIETLIISSVRNAGYSQKTCKTLQDAKVKAKLYLLKTDPEQLTDLIFRMLHIERIPFTEKQSIEKIRLACRGKTYQELKEIAPYAAFILEIEIFSQIALAAERIKCEGNTISDIWYLHYLPFCKYFVSSDKDLRKCANLFMREDQKFIWGPDFKAYLNPKK